MPRNSLEEKVNIRREDLACVVQVQAGDREAFGFLYERYNRPIVSYVYRLVGNVEDAEDVAAETFLRALNKIDTYTPGSFSAWLYRIAHNLAVDFHRKKSKKPQQYVDISQLFLPDEAFDANPASVVERRELKGEVGELIRLLPSYQQELLTMRYFEEMSYRQMAEELGSSEGALRVAVHRSKITLLEKIALYGSEELKREGIALSKDERAYAA